MIQVKVKKLLPDAKLPEFANDYAVGADLFAAEETTLHPFDIKAIGTGIAIELPDNYQAEIRSRSGLALKHGIFVLNSPGTIDPDYRGEIKVILCNLSYEAFHVKKHMKIAQLVIMPRIPVKFTLTDELSKTERNTNGFGSTGYF